MFLQIASLSYNIKVITIVSYFYRTRVMWYHRDGEDRTRRCKSILIEIRRNQSEVTRQLKALRTLKSLQVIFTYYFETK